MQVKPIDEHFLHRLEAFSDIVIALSLSEIAFNLQVPVRSRDIFSHPRHLIGFVAGFVFVASIWWLHNRIFARYFVPDAIGVITNFALLAAIVLFAWAQALFYRFGLDPSTAILYASSGGFTFILVGALFLRGVRDPRLQLSPEESRQGFWRGVRTLTAGVVFLLSLALAPLGVGVMESSWFAAILAIAILRIAERKATRALS